MIAKIGRGSNLYGALAYNQSKVETGNAQILHAERIIQTADGSYSLSQILKSFEPYLEANRKTENPILHISLNPDPKDKVSDEDYKSIAQSYLEKLGYGQQPFVLFKHTDIERTHIHIVSVCVDEEGRKISDKFEKRRSMDVCRALESEYCLHSATEKKENSQNQIFKPVDYRAGDIKSQMASVIRLLPKYYSFQTFGTYNALLSLFNITAEEVRGEYNGITRAGLVYFALNKQGEKASNPFKASLFGKSAGYVQLNSHYAECRKKLKDNPVRDSVKNKIERVMQTADNQTDFKKQLINQGISTVLRCNAQGCIYGITFIDHASKTVWNGSDLGKNLSANIFNDWWDNGNKANLSLKNSSASKENFPADDHVSQSHSLFGFLGKEETSYNGKENSIVETFGSLLPQTQGEDFQEMTFANQLKRNSKRRKPKL
ncbi:conjugal transfer protein MobB [Flavobacterium aquicola]|uniref:Relaxase/mobilization nuclease-like protein n=1 Tax=Flavobacterium aquicola TaxID=1682742 RepID=A0A3E0E8R4_9FLAO|nr:conjugal transfer protein MobB [Flavobacterium aquicola]REG94050.1 relaxase/mobilization nuclease-like protein [Flavobacterium aquicola]